MQNIASFASKGRIFQGKSGDVFSGPKPQGRHAFFCRP